MSDVCDVCERPKCCDARARWLAATSGTFDACQMKATECHGGGPCWKLGYTSLRTALSAAEGREAALRGVVDDAIAEFNRRADVNEGKAKKASRDASGIFSGASLAYEFAADYLKTLRAAAAPTPATEPRTP